MQLAQVTLPRAALDRVSSPFGDSPFHHDTLMPQATPPLLLFSLYRGLGRPEPAQARSGHLTLSVRMSRRGGSFLFLTR